MSALLNIIGYGLIDRIFTAYKGIKKRISVRKIRADDKSLIFVNYALPCFNRFRNHQMQKSSLAGTLSNSCLR